MRKTALCFNAPICGESFGKSAEKHWLGAWGWIFKILQWPNVLDYWGNRPATCQDGSVPSKNVEHPSRPIRQELDPACQRRWFVFARRKDVSRDKLSTTSSDSESVNETYSANKLTKPIKSYHVWPDWVSRVYVSADSPDSKSRSLQNLQIHTNYHAFSNPLSI